ncbi:unnamed protein product [Lactuca virosa]|uniref:Aconitase/3-isopropylmalate dehydratase large subunit alpha/beta/alpha domain-containing protein n=1 Tax=Lactuca virosa TaxID=75947 RepID=A0AAU9MGZ3_9ASTR|nr:unnamed protein product [Lactuca virosa]
MVSAIPPPPQSTSASCLFSTASRSLQIDRLNNAVAISFFPLGVPCPNLIYYRLLSVPSDLDGATVLIGSLLPRCLLRSGLLLLLFLTVFTVVSLPWVIPLVFFLLVSASDHALSGILTGLPKPGGGEFGKFYSLPALNDPRVDKLPYSIRILLESAIRNCDNFQVTKAYVKKAIDWEKTSPNQVEIPFKPARVLLQISGRCRATGGGYMVYPVPDESVVYNSESGVGGWLKFDGGCLVDDR